MAPWMISHCMPGAQTLARKRCCLGKTTWMCLKIETQKEDTVKPFQCHILCCWKHPSTSINIHQHPPLHLVSLNRCTYASGNKSSAVSVIVHGNASWLCMEMPHIFDEPQPNPKPFGFGLMLFYMLNFSMNEDQIFIIQLCTVSIIIYIVIWIFNFWFQQLLILRPFPQSSDAMPVDSRRHPLGERGALTAKNVEDSGYVNRTNKHGLGGSIMFGIRIWVTAGGIMRLPTQETPTLQWVEAWAIRQDLRREGWAAGRCWLFYAVFMSLSGPFQVEKLLIPLWGTV